MWLKEQLALQRLPGRNKPIWAWWKRLNQAQELAKQGAFQVLQDNKTVCQSFNNKMRKISESERKIWNRGDTKITSPWESAFYVSPNNAEISVRKTDNNDFEREFQDIKNQLPQVLGKDSLDMNDYFPSIRATDSTETLPKKATKRYIQKIYQLLFYKMYSVNVKPDNHTSQATKAKRDIEEFLASKFWLKNFQTSYPHDMEDAEENFLKHPKAKR